MKIVHVNWLYFPDLHGGGIIYSYNLINHLAKLGHQVKVFCGSSTLRGEINELKKDLIQGIEVARVSIKTDNLLQKILPFLIYQNSYVAKIFQDYLLDEKPDLIHFHTPIALGVALVSVPKQLGIPSVSTLHEGWWICCQRFFDNKLDFLPCREKKITRCILCVADPHKKEKLHKVKFCFRLFRSILNTPLINSYLYRQLNSIDLLICPSLFLTEKYVASGIKREKIINITHGIETTLFRGIKRTGSKKLRFGFLGGTNIPLRGFCILMDAIKKIYNKDKFSLDIWGTIDMTLAEEVIKNNPGLDIKFHNRFSRDRVAEVFYEMDILIFSSLVSDNCPLIILEAFAAGVPVIATRVGGIPELVCDGVNGFLFNFADSDDLARKINKVLDKPDLISELASRIKPVKNMEEHTKEIVSIYLKLIKKNANYI